MGPHGAKTKCKHGGARFSTKPKCGAKAKSAGGRPCQLRAGFKTDHVGTGRCHIHGGRSLTLHGRYAKVVPTALLPEYTEAVQSGLMTDMREELALLDTVVIPGTIKRGINKAKRCGEVDPLMIQAAVIEVKSKALKRLHDMNDSHKIKFSESGLDMFLRQIVMVVAEFVDGATLKKIANRLGSQPLPVIE